MAKIKDLKKPNTKGEVTESVNLDEIDPETLDKARNEVRTSMREKFGKWVEVYNENATDDDIVAARKEFNEKVEQYQNKKYVISRVGDGLPMKTALFLKEFNKKFNEWQQASWKGVIVFDKVIDEIIDSIEDDPDKPLEIDYSTLIFLYNSMRNPHGVGLESARQMAAFMNYNPESDELDDDSPVTYRSIYDFIYDHVNKLQLVDRMLKLYQERITMAAAGIKFDFKCTEIEEFKELSDAWVVSSLPEDPNELKKVVQQ